MSLAEKFDPAAAPDSVANRLQQLLINLGQAPLSTREAEMFATYLGLLRRWNEKINLTAIRNEEDILRRHFVESIACARLLPPGIRTLLDYGSGAGFPGLPCAICRPEIQVTLGESQQKKAAFLRQVVLGTGVSAKVYQGRVESMGQTMVFDAVTARAVDRMEEACIEALDRVKENGWLAVMTTRKSLGIVIGNLAGSSWQEPVDLPGSDQEVLLLGRKLAKREHECSTWNIHLEFWGEEFLPVEETR